MQVKNISIVFLDLLIIKSDTNHILDQARIALYKILCHTTLRKLLQPMAIFLSPSCPHWLSSEHIYTVCQNGGNISAFLYRWRWRWSTFLLCNTYPNGVGLTFLYILVTPSFQIPSKLTKLFMALKICQYKHHIGDKGNIMLWPFWPRVYTPQIFCTLKSGKGIYLFIAVDSMSYMRKKYQCPKPFDAMDGTISVNKMTSITVVQHIVACTTWLPLCRWHFQMQFVQEFLIEI